MSVSEARRARAGVYRYFFTFWPDARRHSHDGLLERGIETQVGWECVDVCMLVCVRACVCVGVVEI